jgi:hypothetical protein
MRGGQYCNTRARRRLGRRREYSSTYTCTDHGTRGRRYPRRLELTTRVRTTRVMQSGCRGRRVLRHRDRDGDHRQLLSTPLATHDRMSACAAVLVGLEEARDVVPAEVQCLRPGGVRAGVMECISPPESSCKGRRQRRASARPRTSSRSRSGTASHDAQHLWPSQPSKGAKGAPPGRLCNSRWRYYYTGALVDAHAKNNSVHCPWSVKQSSATMMSSSRLRVCRMFLR